MCYRADAKRQFRDFGMQSSTTVLRKGLANDAHPILMYPLNFILFNQKKKSQSTWLSLLEKTREKPHFSHGIGLQVFQNLDKAKRPWRQKNWENTEEQRKSSRAKSLRKEEVKYVFWNEKSADALLHGTLPRCVPKNREVCPRKAKGKGMA